MDKIRQLLNETVRENVELSLLRQKENILKELLKETRKEIRKMEKKKKEDKIYVCESESEDSDRCPKCDRKDSTCYCR